MSIPITIFVGILIAGFLFVLTYFTAFKLCENNKWLIGWGWICIIGLIVVIVSVGITVMLSFLVSLTPTVLITAIFWGAGLGIVCGLVKYRLTHRIKQGY